MEVDCEGCAACCIDWRAVAPADLDHERRGPHKPLDDTYGLAPLSRDEVRGFLDAGLGDVMVPRLWEAADEDETTTIDGHRVVAMAGNPVFFVGLRKPPKPVGPFGLDRTWLPACVFLDPETLQCRIHGDERYPDTCRDYPGQNLELGQETECERVEAAFGGRRLLDASPPETLRGLHLGPQAVGAKLFVHPDPGRLDGVVDRAARSELTREDRAEFVGVAAGSSPGTTRVNEDAAKRAREQVLAADSWAGQAIEAWERRAGEVGTDADDARGAGDDVETARGAPETPGW